MKILTLLIISVLLSSCLAYKIQPDEVSGNQTEMMFSGKVKITTEYPNGNGERWLSDALARQNLADSVVTSTSQDLADYGLNLQSNYTGRCFSEPMLTVITLGIIPSFGCAEIGYTIILTDGNGARLATADSGGEVKTVFGIAAWILMLSPSWVGPKGIVEYEANSIIRVLSESAEKLE